MFLQILKSLNKSTGTVFLSKLAHDHFQRLQNLTVPVMVTPHPAATGGTAHPKNTQQEGRAFFAITSHYQLEERLRTNDRNA